MKNAITDIGSSDYPLYAALPDGDWYVPTKSEFETMLENLTENQIDFEYSTLWTSTFSDGNIYFYSYGDWETQPCSETSECYCVMKITF